MKLSTFILACLTCVGLNTELFFTPEMISTHLKPYTKNEIQLLKKDLIPFRKNNSLIFI